MPDHSVRAHYWLFGIPVRRPVYYGFMSLCGWRLNPDDYTIGPVDAE